MNLARILMALVDSIVRSRIYLCGREKLRERAPGTVRRASPYQAHSLMKKRTQRGHGGQGTDRSAAGKAPGAGKQNDCRLTTTAAADATSRQSEACPAAERSMLVRCVRAVSALCPLLHGRRRRNLRHPNSNGSRPRTAVHEPSVRHLERGIAGRVAPIPPTPSRCAARLRPPHSPDRCLTPTPWPRARRARASRPRPRRRLRPSPY